jgi:site-specific recombinase XerD
MLPAVRSKKELTIALSQKLPRYFHKNEIDAILETVRNNDKYSLLINLLWQTGARISEILALKVKDIDFHNKTIRMNTLKRKNWPQRVLPLQGALLGQLGAYIALKQLQKEHYVLNITRQRAHQIIKEAVLKAGFDKERAHPHAFRHSFAVFSVLSGVPILVIKNWLGHSNIQSTLVYMQVLGSDTRGFYEGLQF